MSSAEGSCDGKVEKVVKSQLSTPQNATPPEVMEMAKKEGTLNRVQLGLVAEQLGIGTPVRKWPAGFWSARKNLYKESQAFKPDTSVQRTPTPSSPQAK